MKNNKKVILVGGCFDVLHPGHIVFLEKAKKLGGKLVVLLESDKKVRELKGEGRPIHNQKERENILKSLRFVDKVIPLPFMESDEDYDQVILKIKPDVIAVTAGEKNIEFHKRSAKLSGAKVKIVTKMVGNHSTSRILTGRS